MNEFSNAYNIGRRYANIQCQKASRAQLPLAHMPMRVDFHRVLLGMGSVRLPEVLRPAVNILL